MVGMCRDLLDCCAGNDDLAQEVGGRKSTKVMHCREEMWKTDGVGTKQGGGLALYIDMALGTDRTNKEQEGVKDAPVWENSQTCPSSISLLPRPN